MSVVRPAATVLLLRDGNDGPEILMLRRHSGAGFAADAWVFPGGVVDEADTSLSPACWAGIEPGALVRRFRAEPAAVLGFHVAAVRETFEEAGLLLATREGNPVSFNAPDVRAQRAELHAAGRAGAGRFGEWLQERGLVLRLDLLTYLSRWVTPVGEPRRYDTCFFLARAPAGQIADHDRTETTGQRWLAPADALAAHREGTLSLMFPTVHTLRALADAQSVDAAIASAAAQPQVRLIQPHLEMDDDGRPVRLLHPDEPDYPAHLYA